MIKKALFASAAVCFAMLVGCATSATAPGVSNKWRLQVDGNAAAAGKIGLTMRSAKARIARVMISIPTATTENDVARRLRDELKLKLPADRYEVEVDDGEDVLIKKRGEVEDFEVRVVRNTVKGVNLRITTE